MMEGTGAEISQKIRSAIKAKLTEIGVYVDEELPDYVMVMVANKRSKEQMDGDLQLFLGKHTSQFTLWLHQVLRKLQEVTVANIGGAKRKLSDDPKKKKKAKIDSEKKEPRKKIKVESEEEEKKELLKAKPIKSKPDFATEDEHDNISSSHHDKVVGPKKKNKTAAKTDVDEAKGADHKMCEESSSTKDNQQQHEENNRGVRSKSQSMSSQLEDQDDEDCINIRTDGELLDTAEDVTTEEPSKEKEDSNSFKITKKGPEKKDPILSQNPIKNKDVVIISAQNSVDRVSQKSSDKNQTSPHQIPPRCNDKVVDARELLNRKKAAKQTETKAKSLSRDRSSSPPRKRKNDGRRVYRGERDTSKRLARDEDRGRRNARDSYSSRHRAEDRSSDRNDLERHGSRNSRRRKTSSEPPSKKVMMEKPFRNKNDESNRTLGSYKMDIYEPPAKRREPEELRKRSGLVSRVVPRPQEPEEEVETPVPSVVRVTPRPRRPTSQQPSSTLIMKAISEANKSLAKVPPRPDSTQTRKEPVFTRTLRQLERIPPEKIAVSITNPMALKKADKTEKKEERDNSMFPINDEEIDSRPMSKNNVEDNTSCEPDNSDNIESEVNSIRKNEENVKVECEDVDNPKPEHEVETIQGLETYKEPTDGLSDTQFVVTLNGYDPESLYSQSVLDLDEGDNDDWLKENVDEEPLQTSTPDQTYTSDEAGSPRPKRDRKTSPTIITNMPAVNHSNLIEVEIVKNKSVERCKYWPACKLADKCTYYHPTKPCKVFPACKFGDACLYIHPQCKFNVLCTRKGCVFAHTPAHTPLQPAAAPKAKALLAASALQPCKFYPKCTNINCQFAHPSRACRFGLYCTKKGCSFDHGQVAPKDKLKWTRVPTT